MKAASILEVSTVPAMMTRPAEPPPVSIQSPRTFKDSLLALAKPSSEKETCQPANPANRLNTVPHIRTVLPGVATPQAQQPSSVNQQPLLIGLKPAAPRGAGLVTITASSANPVVVQPPALIASDDSNPVPKSISSFFSGVAAGPLPVLVPNELLCPIPIIAAATAPTLALPLNQLPSDVASALPVTSSQSTQTLGVVPIVPRGVPALSAAPLPALRSPVDPPATKDAAQSPASATTGKASPPPASDPTAMVTGTDTIADQLAVLVEPSALLPMPVQQNLDSAATAKPTAVPGADGLDAGNAVNNLAGTKQHSQPTDQAQSQTGSQDAASSLDQNQSMPAQQEQGVAPVPTSFANHIATPVAHSPDDAMTVPLQSSPQLEGRTTKAQDNVGPPVLLAPQALPVINTARLIQNMGQSEMRVGMRSSDFGNISISTSATRDLVSAQISLEHGELARTIAFHLPEIQTRLGSNNQALNVRIDLNGQATGTSAGMSNGSGDGSRGDRQQKAGTAPIRAVHGFQSQDPVSTVTMPTGESRLDARLDITA